MMAFTRREPSNENLEEKLTLAEIDRSCRMPVIVFFVSALFWLLAGTVLAMVASLKMHTPDFLADAQWLTFGRVRPAHLNTMAYGWAGMAGIAVILWMQARLSKRLLPAPKLLVGVAVAWNLTVLAGTISILAGGGTSVEWLEFPLPVALILGGLFSIIGALSMFTFFARRNVHVYVSQWYVFGAILWFPYLYVVANLMIHGDSLVETGLAGRGSVQASANWWFAHNVLGLWLTPIGVATAYYLIPKVLGRPIHSYYLSILGFWTLALFYNWAGSHHLIGGPIPAWLITVGTVGSMMMIIPVTTVAINHHFTTVGNFRTVWNSPTLRFVVFGAMSYTAVSFQGSLQSLRWVNEINHFTHYTIAHAHLGVYAFFTMMMFGAAYYVLPRMTGIEWASSWMIRTHFWTSGLGMAVYWLGLTYGGWFQGLKMNDAENEFLSIVSDTIPYLWSRSAAGLLMTVGHIVFTVLVARMLLEWYRRTRAGTREAAGNQTAAEASA